MGKKRSCGKEEMRGERRRDRRRGGAAKTFCEESLIYDIAKAGVRQGPLDLGSEAQGIALKQQAASWLASLLDLVEDREEIGHALLVKAAGGPLLEEKLCRSLQISPGSQRNVATPRPGAQNRLHLAAVEAKLAVHLLFWVGRRGVEGVQERQVLVGQAAELGQLEDLGGDEDGGAEAAGVGADVDGGFLGVVGGHDHCWCPRVSPQVSSMHASNVHGEVGAWKVGQKHARERHAVGEWRRGKSAVEKF